MLKFLRNLIKLFSLWFCFHVCELDFKRTDISVFMYSVFLFNKLRYVRECFDLSYVKFFMKNCQISLFVLDINIYISDNVKEHEIIASTNSIIKLSRFWRSMTSKHLTIFRHIQFNKVLTTKIIFTKIIAESTSTICSKLPSRIDYVPMLLLGLS